MYLYEKYCNKKFLWFLKKKSPQHCALELQCALTTMNVWFCRSCWSKLKKTLTCIVACRWLKKVHVKGCTTNIFCCETWCEKPFFKNVTCIEWCVWPIGSGVVVLENHYHQGMCKQQTVFHNQNRGVLYNVHHNWIILHTYLYSIHCIYF